VADEVFADLLRAYSGPGRYYHTLAHVRQVLGVLETGRARAADFAALQFAAWFHDAVYDPRAGDNEEQSAAAAGRALARMGVPAPSVAAAQGLILETKTHQPSADEYDRRLFLDADLAILGADEESYNAYARAVRQEYAWVPEPAYRAGRRQVLRAFLGRPRVYRTEALFAARESRARSNMEKEIGRLSGEGSPDAGL
jgi:predicted metal-dependent HD superfamily phosphohydrolase